jgi:hypothetical protein
MADSHRIASRDGVPFDFSDGLKIAGFLLSGNDGGKAIKVLIKDTDTTPTDLYTWARSVAAAVSTLQANSTTATTAVNQAAGNNSTLIANTAFVTAAVAAAITQIVAAAPANMNTLQELAAAIGNDPSYSTTVTAALANKVSLAQMQASAPMFAAATVASTVDAIAATFTPAVASNVAGLHFIVRTKGGNTSIAPTFTPNPGIVPVKTIVKGTGIQLQPGDIGLFAVLQYDPSADSYVLLNPNYAPNVILGTTTQFGVVALATSAEAIAGANTTKAITPATLNAAIQSAVNSVAGVVRTPSFSTPAPYHEKGSPFTVNVSATPIAPDTSITSFELTVDGFQVVTSAATANAAAVALNANITDNKALYTSYQLTAVAIGNTGSRSPSSVLPITITGVAKPTITFPVVGTRTTLTPTFTSSAFTVSVGTDTHAASTWEILDPAGTVVYTVSSALVKTSMTIPANVLKQGQNYTARVRHVGTTYTRPSEWSDMLSFATQNVLSQSVTLITPAVVDSASMYGWTTALSDSGLSVVGAPQHSGALGVVDLKKQNTPGSLPFNTTLTRQGSFAGDEHGAAVKLSANASRLAVCSPGSGSGFGNTSVFSVTANTGGITLTSLVGLQMSDVPNQNGNSPSLACNSDMTLLAVGNNEYYNGSSTGAGRVVIYRNTVGSTWEVETILVPQETASGGFGIRVAMDAAGEWLAVTNNSGIPRVNVYKRLGFGWSLQQSFLPDWSGYGSSPLPVAFNAAGTRLVLGSPAANFGNGAVYIYNLIDGVWENTHIWYDTSSTNVGGHFGSALDLSADGDVMVVTSPDADIGGYTNLGKACIVRYTGTSWVQDTTDITVTAINRADNLRMGAWSVAINPAGTHVLIGNPNGYLVAGQVPSAIYTPI